MMATSTALSPPERLAVAHAPPDLRPSLTLLLTFDNKLSDIVGRAKEPMIAQMKFAWWHDAIARDPATRPRGEPILKALNLSTVPGLDTDMECLLEAWEQLLASDEWTSDILNSFAKRRSAGIFGSYVRWVTSEFDVEPIGKNWALADLRMRFGSRVSAVPLAPSSALPLSKELRPLSILSLSVRQPSGARMVWHALTGR